MTCRDIYKAALPLMGEVASESNAERAEELLTSVIYCLLPVDRLKKKSVGETAIPAPKLSTSLDDVWPLDSCFLPCAAHYLAAYMLGSEDPDLSVMLYARAEALKRIISDQIPFVIEKIA